MISSLAAILVGLLATGCQHDPTTPTGPDGTCEGGIHARLEFPCVATNGTIAFVDLTSESGVPIVSILRSGGDVESVVVGDTPTWSPTGDSLAYVRGGAIYAIDLRTRSERRLTESIEAYFPAWSPDGKVVAFDRITPVSEAGIWSIEVESGGALFRLTQPGVYARMPSWSPDGRRLAASLYNELGRMEVGIIELATGSVARITADPTFDERRPQWSPDGTTILYRGRDGLRIYEVSGGNDVLLSGTKDPCLRTWQSGCWDASGGWIIYNKVNLWRIRPDGSGNQRFLAP